MTSSHLSSNSSPQASIDDAPPRIPKWNPNWNHFPPRRTLKVIPGAPPGAAWFWGPDDYLGRLNLLTPARVLKAKEEIRTGEMVSVNLPLDEPDPPTFGREKFRHEIKDIANGISFDDMYSLNTQSGTQWDGFRHVSCIPISTFFSLNQSPETFILILE
jgi:hypothetical protein